MGCRRSTGVGALVRVVRRPDGSLGIGRGLPGRGAWVCDGSPACVDVAVRRRAFERALRGPVDPASVAALRAMLAERARMKD